jgi:hypothetical protein
MPALRAKLEHYTGERPLFDLYSVEPEIEKALSRRVDLNSGGTLVIDQTEAMTTIDVNTGGFVGSRTFDDTVFKTNLEAAQAIARQLRLRNLGGIIIVDFIDMESAEHRAAVLEEFKRALAMLTDFTGRPVSMQVETSYTQEQYVASKDGTPASSEPGIPGIAGEPLRVATTRGLSRPDLMNPITAGADANISWVSPARMDCTAGPPGG